MYYVMSAHQKRKCHSETCCCPTEYVIVQGGLIIENVDSEDEGIELIETYKQWGLEDETNYDRDKK